jgi:hypothetical protein
MRPKRDQAAAAGKGGEIGHGRHAAPRERPGRLPISARSKTCFAVTTKIMLMAILLTSAGCGSRELVVDYGHRGGSPGDQSVNGTAVLAEMFSKAGHEVETRHNLTPSLEAAQTILWFPDALAPPSPAIIKWFEDWLRNESGRTLIYVGRDFDAERDYWQQSAKLGPADERVRCQEHEAEARLRMKLERRALPESAKCDWFEVRNDAEERRAVKLSGPWAAGLAVAKTNLGLKQRLLPPDWFEMLLESDGDMLVSREVVQTSDQWRQLVLVANGSFLLNYPLVNREHRKLAGRLIELVETPGRVVFLETGPRGPKILDADPAPELPQALALFAVWPLNVVLLHLAAVGIIFCFARWPVFGTARESAPVDVSDFSQHAAALGKLLERTADRDFAERRLAEYRNPKVATTRKKPPA